jgi:hypothetical protein
MLGKLSFLPRKSEERISFESGLIYCDSTVLSLLAIPCFLVERKIFFKILFSQTICLFHLGMNLWTRNNSKV